MPETTSNEQETITTEEVVSLLNVETPDTSPVRKGYDDYVKEAQEAETNVDTETAGQEAISENTFDIPEKFKGKSAAEIAASYVELQSEYGRKSTEVGSLRKLTDQLLELKDKTKPEVKETPKVSAESLLENPGDTINSAVNENPRLKAIEDKIAGNDLAVEKSKFEEKYPDWQKTLNAPEFQKWIMGSPIRQRLFVEADKNYDYATGTELLDMYTELKGNAIKDAKDERNSNARKNAKQAITESGSASSSKAKPKFRRTELIQLKLTNPAKYEAMLPEIMAAYAEKRVI